MMRLKQILENKTFENVLPLKRFA